MIRQQYPFVYKTNGKEGLPNFVLFESAFWVLPHEFLGRCTAAGSLARRFRNLAPN
jgi:hypothetical protein